MGVDVVDAVEIDGQGAAGHVLPETAGLGGDAIAPHRRIEPRRLGASRGNAAHARLLAKRRSIDREERSQREERRAARHIQQGFLPKTVPTLPGMRIAGRLMTPEDVGGDFYDFVPARPDGRDCLDVLVGDASGHGMAAALTMAETRAYVRALALTCADPGRLVTLTNRRMADHLVPGHFVTLLLVRLDPLARSLRYTSAGHWPGYVLDRRGRVRTTLPSVGIPIGIDAESEYSTGPDTRLEPGDLALLFTDGIVEAASPAGQPFGLERALDVVRNHQGESPAKILDALFDAVSDFGRGHLNDDVTAVVIQVDEPPCDAGR